MHAKGGAGGLKKSASHNSMASKVSTRAPAESSAASSSATSDSGSDKDRLSPTSRPSLTIAALDGVNHVLSLPVKDLTVTPAQDLAGMPRDDVAVDLALTDADAAPAYRSMGGMRGLGALVRSLATAGALETILRMSVEYANDRVQFGRPIGKFQSIQQYLATMAGETAAARAAAEMAAGSYDTAAFALTVAAAKSRSGEAAQTVGALAHQIHGAIGYTEEHALHHFTKRIWSWQDEFGTELDWNRELGRAALSSPHDTFWHFITDSTAQGVLT